MTILPPEPLYIMMQVKSQEISPSAPELQLGKEPQSPCSWGFLASPEPLRVSLDPMLVGTPSPGSSAPAGEAIPLGCVAAAAVSPGSSQCSHWAAAWVFFRARAGRCFCRYDWLEGWMVHERWGDHIMRSCWGMDYTCRLIDAGSELGTAESRY